MLLGDARHLLLQTRVLGGLDRVHEDADEPIGVEEGRDRDIGVNDVSVAAREGDVVHAAGGVAGLHVLDARAQALHAIAHVEVTELARESVGRGNVEQRLRRGIPAEDRVAHVDDQDRGRQRLQRALHARPGCHGLPTRSDRRPLRRYRLRQEGRRLARARWRALEDPPLRVHGREQTRARQQRFRAAEEEDAVLTGRIVKPGEDALLQLAREIDEDVPADEQVDVRQRRRLREIVAAEDAPAAEVAPEPMELAVAGEVAIHEPVGHIPQLFRPVRGVARGGEGLLVDVGAIDLDRVGVGRLAEVLGQEHGDRIRLLAGGAARAPDAQTATLRRVVDEPRNDVVGERFPRVRVPKERGDVDEDRVEERDVLDGIRIEEL